MHKKLYKAGKKWLVASIMTGAAVISLSIINAHADQLATRSTDSQNIIMVQKTNNQQFNNNQLATSTSTTPAVKAVATSATSSQDLQEQINQAQQAVDNQQQVVNNQQDTVKQSWNDYSRAIDQDNNATQAAKAAEQAYNDQQAQVDNLYNQYNMLFQRQKELQAQEDQLRQGDQYQSLLQQAKAICPEYYSSNYAESLQSTIDLRNRSESQYQQFMSLIRQMDDLLGDAKKQADLAQDQAMAAYSKWSAAYGALKVSDVYRNYQSTAAALKAADIVQNQAHQRWNNARTQLANDENQLAALINHLADLKQQWLDQQQQVIHCTITYVDDQGRTIGSEVITGKSSQVVNNDSLHLPENYQLKSNTVVLNNTNVTIPVVAVPEQVVHKKLPILIMTRVKQLVVRF